jgi:ferredoxin
MQIVEYTEKRQQQWGASCRTPGACTICMVMWLNGAGTGIMMSIMQRVLLKIPEGLIAAIGAFFAAATGRLLEAGCDPLGATGA